MPMLEKYRHYFDIDPDFFPAVNEAVIMKNPEMWKKFFPHETFVKLLKNMISVLERKQKLCLWVEGAYGTGKSYAVLTLKKLIDSTAEETREYFQRYKMDNDLYNRFQAVKSSGRILTVHRYGSATIRSDHNLVFAIQESIEKSLVDAGIENKGGNALKEATIAWLSDKDNKNYFNGLITGTYSKNDRGDEIKGFQWFIDNFGPEDDNPLLSVDMLWEFFYEKGKEYLAHDIRSIYDVLKAAPYGFMPCNLSAFILGFVLKEYASSGTYSWSDGLTNDALDVNKLKEMIDEVIRLEITPNPRYKDKYIVAMTPAEKAFNEITSVAFGIPLNMCTSIPNTRERIRSKMKEFSFPIWTLKYILEKETLQTETAVLSDIIDSFCGIANSNNMGSETTDSEIAKMPILCLVPDSEVAKAKVAFAAVNRPKTDEQSIDRATEYFASAKFFDLLDDAAALDKAFRSSIIGTYSVMLTDIQEVKDYLDSHITAEPFDWFGLPEIEKKLRQMAEAKYNQGGCDRALAKIDEMDIADVKKYLKDLIRDNMIVGMEIIKGN